jgi:hypothetical protein
VAATSGSRNKPRISTSSAGLVRRVKRPHIAVSPSTGEASPQPGQVLMLSKFRMSRSPKYVAKNSISS